VPWKHQQKDRKRRGRIWQGILIIHLLMPGFVGRSNCDEKPNPSRDSRQGILRKNTMCLYTQASTNLERERERERELWQPDNAPKKEEVHLNETLAS
jgi:hypothetical protein